MRNVTKSVTRRAVDTWLRSARLPVDVARKVTKADPATFGPGLLFDRVDATVRQVAGTLTGDEELKGSGRRREAVVDLREQAAAKAAEAERIEAEAEARRLEAEEEARRKQEEADRRAAEKLEAREAQRRREEAAAQTVADRDRKAAAARKRQADKRRLTAEERAVAAKEQVAAAAVREVALDQAEQSLARRR